jgi:ubiquinone/menaquinone biosynthesis C-methylase UbiE
MENLKQINQKTRSAYNLAAEKYYRLFYDELDKKEFDRNILDEFSSCFDKNSIVCDAGCGPCGYLDSYISGKGINVIGIDISDKCIDIAKRNNPNIKFERSDFSNLKYNDCYFDGIISYYSIIDTPKAFIPDVLIEFKRVLKKGGHLLVVVKKGVEDGFINNLLGIKTEIYFSSFNESELKELIAKAGFKIEKCITRNPYDFEIQNDRIYIICRKQ